MWIEEPDVDTLMKGKIFTFIKNLGWEYVFVFVFVLTL